jgi:hypothetical protein
VVGGQLTCKALSGSEPGFLKDLTCPRPDSRPFDRMEAWMPERRLRNELRRVGRVTMRTGEQMFSRPGLFTDEDILTKTEVRGVSQWIESRLMSKAGIN